MSMHHLGTSFDIHTGGVDLVFPHHEDEIAQSEAATGLPFVRTWLHCAHLQMSGSKMAKSTGNIARVSDLLESGVEPRVLRLALISVHYRASLNYTPDTLSAAAAAIDRIDALVAALAAYRQDRADDAELPGVLSDARGSFDAALDDDLNISAGLGALFDLVREVNRRLDGRTLSTADAERVTAWLRLLDVVLGILADEDDELGDELKQLLDERLAARARRDWAASDRLRDELIGRGIAIEDTRDGQRWRRLVEAGRG
jgi:cysteinyl-tRNA synthetase